jgi:hypothetical protein
MNLIKDSDQISVINNELNSSQPFSSANIPIHTDDSGLSSDVDAVKEVRFLAQSEPSTTSSLASSSSSPSLSLTDDSLGNDLESSDSDFSPLFQVLNIERLKNLY